MDNKNNNMDYGTIYTSGIPVGCVSFQNIYFSKSRKNHKTRVCRLLERMGGMFHNTKIFKTKRRNKMTLFMTPILAHIRNRIKTLENMTRCVVALQFSDHPEGLGMVVRVYVPASEKEFVFPDCVLPSEYSQPNETANKRVDVLFDIIEEALKKIQVVSDKSGGLIHHA